MGAPPPLGRMSGGDRTVRAAQADGPVRARRTGRTIQYGTGTGAGTGTGTGTGTRTRL